jgi:plastocyanin
VGETFSYTFTIPGTYNYMCTFHQGMNGSVVVQQNVPAIK